jgi:Mn-dependent DtxR family transcriptional regulator
MEELLRYGNSSQRAYRSRSEVIQALALAAVNAEWTQADFTSSILDRSNAGGEKVQAMTRTVAEKYIHRSWIHAQEYHATFPPVGSRADVRDRLNRIRTAADSMAWRGRGGATDRAVLEAHFGLALELGRLTYHASVRDIAERAGITAPTASRAHGRLRDGGWLRLVHAAAGVNANSWELRSGPGSSCNTPGSASTAEADRFDDGQADRAAAAPRRPGGHDETLGADVWRWRHSFNDGLGQSARRIWNLLEINVPQTTKTLATMLGVTPRAVRRLLARLAQHGLAMRTSSGWCRLNPDLKAVAARVGTFGAAVRQREIHNDDREKYRAQYLRASRRREETIMEFAETGNAMTAGETQVSDVLRAANGRAATQRYVR